MEAALFSFSQKESCEQNQLNSTPTAAGAADGLLDKSQCIREAACACERVRGIGWPLAVPSQNRVYIFNLVYRFLGSVAFWGQSTQPRQTEGANGMKQTFVKLQFQQVGSV